MKKIIKTDKAPLAIGPYSQAVVINGLIYTSGIIPINPQDNTLVTGNIEQQTYQVMDNLKALLESTGSSLQNVIKTTLFIKNMNDFAIINEIYSKYFISDYPARSCVEVARLPKDVSIEIEAIATV